MKIKTCACGSESFRACFCNLTENEWNRWRAWADEKRQFELHGPCAKLFKVTVPVTRVLEAKRIAEEGKPGYTAVHVYHIADDRIVVEMEQR